PGCLQAEGRRAGRSWKAARVRGLYVAWVPAAQHHLSGWERAHKQVNKSWDAPSSMCVCMSPRSETGPAKRFPVGAVDAILQDVLRGYLQEQPYEPGVCREMAKTIAEVIKARVKDLLVPRYKIVVVTHIGQLNEQSMQIGSRCLWDPATDTFSSYVFKNTSLFALANVYAIYFE
uniref:Dynein light chain Tctex-type family member 5 n=1 Tax=Anser brachyrhynchus TaxID=132585 RepID=A0A8B9CJI0_9AVES